MTDREVYRAARTVHLYDRRAERLADRAAFARRVLIAACYAAGATVSPSGQPAPSIRVPGYRVELADDGALSITPTGDPIPHEWTQTSMDDYLDDTEPAA